MSTQEMTQTVLGDGHDRRAGRGRARRGDRPGDPGYDEARAIWNGAHDRRPALIVRCAGVADVMRAVEFARSQDLEVAVRGGSHSIPGFSTTDGGIVIDLQPDAGRARRSRRPAPLAPRAACSGAASITRRRPSGWPSPAGWSRPPGSAASRSAAGSAGWCASTAWPDNLISADVVTADGRLVTASADENPELLWGLKGGGGNFGIATSLEYQVHPVGPMVMGGPTFYPGTARRRSCASIGTSSDDLPDELTTIANLLVGAARAVHPRGVARQAADRADRLLRRAPSRTASRRWRPCASSATRWPT